MAKIKSGGLEKNIGKSISVWRKKPHPKEGAYFLEGPLEYEPSHGFFYVISPDEDDGLILQEGDVIEIPYKSGLFRTHGVGKV